MNKTTPKQKEVHESFEVCDIAPVSVAVQGKPLENVDDPEPGF